MATAKGVAGSKANELGKMARRIRIETITSIHRAGSGHAGGSLSVTDILIALFFDRMRIRPQEPSWEERDRLILSKGHGGPALYATLALKGYFPVEELATLRQMGSRLSGHPSCSKTPGVDMTSGSLGQGLSVGLGMTLAARVKGLNFHVYVLMGDGELQEGQIWEAAMAAVHFKVNGLIAIVDNNRVQLDGRVDKIMQVEPLDEKWRAFGWKVLKVDGHNIQDLLSVLEEAAAMSESGPVVILADTIKGKGVSFMEGKSEWHGKQISAADFQLAMAELEQRD